MGDWREPLLRRFSFPRYERLGRSPVGWPGYQPAEAVRFAIGAVGGCNVVACVWDATVSGGSLGELDAAAVAEAADRAARYGEPLVTFVRTGGVRLQEGMAALVGMPRVRLALRRLAASGVPHVALADHPTTGGVYVSVVARADLRAAVAGATVGFSGPRVAEAMTGAPLPEGSHTAEAAYAAGQVDALLAPDEVEDWLARALAALRPEPFDAEAEPPVVGVAPADGPAQVALARDPARPAAGDLLDAVLPGGVDLRGADGTVRAVVAPGAVGVATAAARGTRVTPAGYALLARAAALAGRLGRPLLSLVDTPGAEPGPGAEAAGVAGAVCDAMDALLGCPAPTVAVVTGEGGSGGALAAAVADRVLVTPGCYFAALGPEGAAATLRLPAAEAAARLRLAPADLLALGFADAAVPEPADPAFPAAVRAHLARAAAGDRERRWAAPLPGSVR